MLTKAIKEILLVDDDLDERTLFELALAEFDPNLKLTQAFTCSAALKELQHCNPDLIFLDVKLDAVSGHDCLREIKASALYCNIPVVIYSNSSAPKDILFSYQLGASLYFKKTSTFQELVRALKAILNLPWSNPQELQGRYFSNGKGTAFELEVEE